MLAVCVLELLYLKFKFNFMNKDTHEVFTEDGGAAGELGGGFTGCFRNPEPVPGALLACCVVRRM